MPSQTLEKERSHMALNVVSGEAMQRLPLCLEQPEIHTDKVQHKAVGQEYGSNLMHVQTVLSK
jgi:hypothetical protein